MPPGASAPSVLVGLLVFFVLVLVGLDDHREPLARDADVDALGDLDDQVAAVLLRLELLHDPVDPADGEDLVARRRPIAQTALLRLRAGTLRADEDEPQQRRTARR